MRCPDRAYLGVEVGEDGQAAGHQAQQDGQHPRPRPNPLLFVPGDQILKTH